MICNDVIAYRLHFSNYKGVLQIVHSESLIFLPNNMVATYIAPGACHLLPNINIDVLTMPLALKSSFFIFCKQKYLGIKLLCLLNQ